MDSFAFWCSKKEDSKEQVEAIMNFNLWTQCGWEDFENSEFHQNYLDVGFIIKNLKATDKLFFYIPFKVSEDKITDLGCKLTQTKVLDAVFNENYCSTDIANQLHWLVKESDASDAKVIFDLSLLKGNNYSVENQYEGTTIIIDSEKIMRYQNADPNRDFYMRFRIKCNKSPQLIREYKPKNSFLQSSIASTYIIDFRFNNLRSLDPELIETAKSENHQFIQFSKLHFFLMTKADIEVDESSRPRELEKDIWHEYVEGHDTTDIVAYHSSVKNKDGETSLTWEFFTKLKVNKSTNRVLFFYLGWLALITIALNLISSWICKFLFKW